MNKKLQNSSSSKQNQSEGDIQNFEDILDRLGGFGLFQIIVVISLLFFEIPIAFTQFFQVFAGASPKSYTCGNVTRDMTGADKLDICTCNETITMPDLTIVGEWSLICDKAWVSDFLTSIQMAGMLFGNMIGSVLSDWYGRRYCFFASISIGGLGQIISAVSPNPYVYAVGRFFCGFSFAWYLGLSGSYSIEFMPTKYRMLCGTLCPFAEGTMLLGLLGYLIRPWRILAWVTTIPFFLVAAVYPFLPESPRWLMQQKKLDELDQVLKYIAKINKTEPIQREVLEQFLRNEEQKQIPEASDKLENNDVIVNVPAIPTISEDAVEKVYHHHTTPKFDKVKKQSFLDLFRPASACRTTICLMTIWFAWAMSYFGVTLNVKNMDGSIYLNIFYLGLAERVGYIIALYLCNSRLGRCTSLLIFMTFSAVSYVVLAILLLVIPNVINQSYPYLIGLFCIIGKIGLSGSRSASRTLTGESYPTNVRSMGIGMSGIAASIGAALAPQIAFLGTYWSSLPYFAFAIITIAGSLFSFLLTETSGKPMQEGTNANNNRIKRLSIAMRRVSVSSILNSMSPTSNNKK